MKFTHFSTGFFQSRFQEGFVDFEMSDLLTFIPLKVVVEIIRQFKISTLNLFFHAIFEEKHPILFRIVKSGQ